MFVFFQMKPAIWDDDANKIVMDYYGEYRGKSRLVFYAKLVPIMRAHRLSIRFMTMSEKTH